MTDEQFIKDFNSKLHEHVSYIDGYLSALNRLTQPIGFKHLFGIRIFNYPEKSKVALLNKELGLVVEKLVSLDKFIGEIEKAIQKKVYRCFLGGEYENSSKCMVDAIEILIWDIVEYIDWLNEFSYSCIVEKGILKLREDESGEIYCFSLNQEYFVVFCIKEIKINQGA